MWMMLSSCSLECVIPLQARRRNAWMLHEKLHKNVPPISLQSLRFASDVNKPLRSGPKPVLHKKFTRWHTKLRSGQRRKQKTSSSPIPIPWILRQLILLRWDRDGTIHDLPHKIAIKSWINLSEISLHASEFDSDFLCSPAGSINFLRSM